MCGELSIDRDKIGDITYGLFFIADALFLAQHWVFTSEYLMCAVTIVHAFALGIDDHSQK